MKFLIVGASGFIGRHLYSLIKSKGYFVIGTQTRARQNDLKIYNLLSDQPIDLCVGKSFFDGKEEKVGIIMGAVRNIDSCAINPEKTYFINVAGAINLAKELCGKGVKVVFISTSHVYDGVSGGYKETDPKSIISDYGMQKSLTEDFVINNIPGSLVFRFDKVLGVDPDEEHLFTEWLRWCKEGKPILCIKGNFFPGTLVDDIAKSILLACEKGLSGLYHVANTKSIYRADLARLFVKIMGFENIEVLEKPMEYFNFKARRSLRTDMDVSKFVGATGMRFTGFEEMIEIFKKNVGTKRE